MHKKRVKYLTLLDQALVSASNFILVFLLTKLLGLSGFGTYSIVWLFAHFSMFISEGFIGEVAMLLVQKIDSDKKDYLKHLFTVVIAYSLIAGAFTFATLSYLPSFNLKDFAFAGTSFALSFNLHWFARRCFHSLRAVKHLLLADTFAYFGRLVTTALALIFFQNLSINAILYVFSGLNLISLLPLLTCLGLPKFKQWGKYSREHYRLSRWLLPSYFMKWFSTYSFIIIAELFFGSTFVGVLRNVQNIFSIPSVLSQALTSYLPKQFGDALKVDVRALFKSVSKTSRWLFLGTAGLGLSISAILYLGGRIYFPELIRNYFSLFLWFSLITTAQIALLPQVVALRTLNDLRTAWQVEFVAFISMLITIFPACLLLNYNGLMLSLALSSSLTLVFSLIKKRKHLITVKNYETTL